MVTNEHLKYAGQSLHRYLAHLFNGILQCEYFPKMYETFTIINIYTGQNKDRNNSASYSWNYIDNSYWKGSGKNIAKPY